MPVASANKVPRPRGGTNNTGEGASGKRIIDVERPPATQFGKKMALTFNWLQDEGVPMAKAIAKLRSIYDEALKEGKKGLTSEGLGRPSRNDNVTISLKGAYFIKTHSGFIK